MKIRVEKILSHTGTQIVFIVPFKIDTGECTVEVRTLPPGNRNVKTGALVDRLSVIQ